VWVGERGDDVRSPAAISKSVFSNQMLTNLSNLLPLIELTGLNVRAVARAASTSALAASHKAVAQVATTTATELKRMSRYKYNASEEQNNTVRNENRTLLSSIVTAPVFPVNPLLSSWRGLQYMVV